MPTITHEGVALHYRDEGLGTPVLLLHAFPLSGEAFWPQLEALPARCRLIVPDHRGFGQSTPGGDIIAMTTLALDALAILDALKIPSAVVGGVSMGGYAAMALLREAAARVRALALIGTQPHADDEAGRKKRAEMAEAVRQRGSEALVDSMMPRLLSPSASHETRARVEQIIRGTRPDGAIAAIRGMAERPDSRELLGRFAGPAVVVAGEKDPIVPIERAQRMSELLAGSELVRLPEAGHLANLEAPAEVNAALERLLERVR